MFVGVWQIVQRTQVKGTLDLVSIGVDLIWIVIAHDWFILQPSLRISRNQIVIILVLLLAI